jgi:hypothetical protein
MVQDQDYYYQYWDGTSYVGKPYVSKYTSYYYDQTQFSAERAAMSSFIRTFLSSGDSLNIIVNDGEKSALGTGPVSFTPSMESDVDKFLLKEMATEARTTGCLPPMNFLRQALQSASAYDTLDLIIIDKAYSYQYPFDSVGVDAEINRLLGILPEKTTVFGLIGYNWNNPVARVQNALIQKRNGMAFYSWGDMNEIFGSIGRTLSPLIDPANISISVTSGGFVLRRVWTSGQAHIPEHADHVRRENQR